MKAHFSVVGHRGWPRRYPDNTLSGLIAAAGVADAVETDVRRCGDGKLVLSHDPVIGGLMVHETPWSVLGETDLGEGHHPVLLEEAIAALPDTPIQLEVKNLPGDPGFEPDHRLALETAQRARGLDMVTCFNPETLKRVHSVFPDASTGLVVHGAITLEEAVEQCLDAGHGSLITHHSLISTEINADLVVYAWTVNDPPRARELVEYGVKGIITDDPGLIATARPPFDHHPGTTR